ncbi:hypothetical protein SAMN05660831_02289 [Thiohalospira halophila DSM 15071]|uniref:Uncharacterized protein n=1 Tax=Thiohalospira halophila DSM 15071 TaxID=1123397 RepID=A0A1I1V1H7_9GAMM|nr:hypothetical protein [Thiohalospira halophila]SFD76932.1 hypothetical protein SAMN05660831_02289 [Thiohalospira halophila DSM 15071]
MSRKRENWNLTPRAGGRKDRSRLSGLLLLILLLLALGVAALFMGGLVEGPGTPGEDGRIPLELPDRERHPVPEGVDRP